MKVYLTRRIPEPALDLLREKFSVSVNMEEGVPTKEQIMERARGSDALLSLLTDEIDGAVMDAVGKQLRIVSNYAVGFDNVDLDAATSRKIYVTNTPYAEAGIEPVAEHAMALILALAKKLVTSDQYVRAGRYKYWEPVPTGLGSTTGLQGKTLGIVGLGRIGAHLAKIAAGFGFGRILYYDIARNSQAEAETGAVLTSLEQLLQESDFVSLHTPLLPQTRHLIDSPKISLMKKEAFLVNTSRGPVVDEAALVQALRRGQIAGAGLDVFEFEPRLSEGLTGLPNVILTPHIASATLKARGKMSEIAAKNIVEALEGRIPPNVVNKEVISS